MKDQYVKTRCNSCMTYFDYSEDLNECPFCKTDAYLTDLTENDIKILKERGFYE